MIVLRSKQPRNVDVVIFDKTGTLTEGKFGVVGISTEGLPEERALALAAAIESDSEHLIARAIRREAESRQVELPIVDQFWQSRVVEFKLFSKESPSMWVGRNF